MGTARIRAPRPEEVRLLRSLEASPRQLTEGPVGRCVKRGWCEVVIEPSLGRAGTQVLYGITDAGRRLVKECAPHPTPYYGGRSDAAEARNERGRDETNPVSPPAEPRLPRSPAAMMASDVGRHSVGGKFGATTTGDGAGLSRVRRLAAPRRRWA